MTRHTNHDSQLTVVVILTIAVIALFVPMCLYGCTINVKRVQVGPDRWPGESTTQPSEIERKIWEDFE